MTILIIYTYIMSIYILYNMYIQVVQMKWYAFDFCYLVIIIFVIIIIIITVDVDVVYQVN